MAELQRVSVIEAREALKSGSILLDIRDPQSFTRRHVTQALPLNNNTISSFINDTMPDTPLYILCYHGISSQQVACYLTEQGFNHVFSIDGGFDAWQQQFPEDMDIHE